MLEPEDRNFFFLKTATYVGLSAIFRDTIKYHVLEDLLIVFNGNPEDGRQAQTCCSVLNE
jgi:hypothetical protein